MSTPTKKEGNNTPIVISIIVASLVIGGALMFSQKDNFDIGNNSSAEEQNINNVSIVDGVQIIELKAKGGYNPEHSIAKIGIPTILRINTRGTFDCSSAVRIPSLNISQNLPPSGVTDIDLGTQKAGVLVGTCGMGMYPFDITFG